MPLIGAIVALSLITAFVIARSQTSKSKRQPGPIITAAQANPSTYQPASRIPKPTIDSQKSEFTVTQNSDDFTQQLSHAYGFAVDSEAQKLYWTSSSTAAFKRADLDGAHVEEIRSNFEAPYHIVIENSFGHSMYFFSEGAIRKRQVDTQLNTETETLLLKIAKENIHGLGFDETLNQLYVGDKYGQINSIIELPSSDADQIDIRMTTRIARNHHSNSGNR